MTTRKSPDKNIRKILRNGDSFAVTLPIEMIRKRGWRERQKVVIRESGKKIIIEDWKE